jgi:hypothetical protein
MTTSVSAVNAVNDSNNSSNNNSQQTAADPQPSTPAVSPEQLVEQIRAIRASVGDLISLTAAERRKIRKAIHVPAESLQAQVNIIDGEVATSLGLSADEVRQMMNEDNRWSAVEYELKSVLDGIQGANLVRRHAIVTAAARATSIGESLARLPKNVVLASQVKEIRRIKRAAAPKKQRTKQGPKQTPQQTPSPATQPQAAGM